MLIFFLSLETMETVGSFTKKKYRYAVIVILLLNMSYCDARRCDAKQIGAVIQNVSLPISTFDKLRPGGLALCARECKYRSRCRSFNYINTTDECQLNGEVMNKSNTVAVGVVYSNINTWPDSIKGECEFIVCTNLHKCVPTKAGCICQQIYYEIKNSHDTALIGYVFGVTASYTEKECAKACIYHAACLSFNYNDKEKLCEMNTKTMITDYRSYIGNQVSTFYSNINRYSETSSCNTRPCNKYSECSPSSGLSSGYTCIVKYCPEPKGPLDIHLIPEYDQYVKLWEVGSTLPYRCWNSYYHDTNWTCLVDGTWQEPVCKAISSCRQLFTSCNPNYANGTYIFKYPETENDIIVNCYTTIYLPFLRLPVDSTYSYYSVKYDDICNNSMGICGKSSYMALKIKLTNTKIRLMEDHVFTTDCNGPSPYQAGKSCVNGCQVAADGEFRVDLRGSGIKHKADGFNVNYGTAVFSHKDHVLNSTCNHCTELCHVKNLEFLSSTEDVNYTGTISPICLPRS